MRESVGSIFLYNIIFVFIFLIFAFLAAIMSYSKAFKVNSIITHRIEKWEGYNDKSIVDITNALSTIGYTQNVEGSTCAGYTRRNKNNREKTAINDGPNYSYNINSAATGTVNLHKTTEMRRYHYCVFLFDGKDDLGDPNHYRYGVTSFIYFDIPIVNYVLRIPIYSQTDSMYYFSFK